MTETKSDRFRIDREEAVGRITLCQGDEGNTLARPDIVALGKAISAFGSDEDVKVVLIQGEGADFCLGRRVDPNAPKPPHARAFRALVSEAILSVYAAIRALPVPVLAVAQGRSKGFGCALAVASDVTIAGKTSMFSLPEMDTNLPPTLAISACLPRMPSKAVMHMVLTRQMVDAETALNHGMISQVVADDALAQSTTDYLANLIDRDRDALIAIKEYIQLSAGMPADAAARYAANLIATEMTSQDRG